ncbi:hypothetical protein, variant 7 [Aphanomyces astaci]|uniref:Uncharacterized protein n=1 Tax=Aphanomyces astaci TaxID=112090 RepID=W4HC89_APHAT|nr:hypothetical protein, variant 6 [Aphanomyces astaci]XP_009821995.1 hypothetical protein, variant 7 [Aphanomyces astaci]ETV89594.1 hypothetical protein, variant 6 [Aphanomyces astaci]ETV89595.1 hypothetical protein, variant 7 [Aphanomyces astaci]|eukprot:XP_009821994.1 hypothetical protein, variant 6 [Aphanomyces astaci]
MTTESSHPAIDSRAEKLTRGSLKSRVDHHLNASCVVILDSLNYIKGCRYELFCMAKENSTTHCVVYVDTPVAISQQRNQDRDGDKFPDIMVDAIARRFEEPLEKNRWDSPLIRVLPDVDDTNVSLVLQHIEQVILHGKVTKAGWATQAVRLSIPPSIPCDTVETGRGDVVSATTRRDYQRYRGRLDRSTAGL